MNPRDARSLCQSLSSVVKFEVGIDSSLNQLLTKVYLRLYVGVGVGTLGETLYTSYLLPFILDSESLTAVEAYNLQETRTYCSFATAFALGRNYAADIPLNTTPPPCCDYVWWDHSCLVSFLEIRTLSLGVCFSLMMMLFHSQSLKTRSFFYQVPEVVIGNFNNNLVIKKGQFLFFFTKFQRFA